MSGRKPERRTKTLGFRTGTGIPAVFPKRVTRVQVRYWILAHHAHRVPVPRCHGYSQVNYLVVVSFLCIIFIAIFLISLSKMSTKNDRSFKLRQTRQIVVFAFIPPPTRSTANTRPLGHYQWVSGARRGRWGGSKIETER